MRETGYTKLYRTLYKEATLLQFNCQITATITAQQSNNEVCRSSRHRRFGLPSEFLNFVLHDLFVTR